MQIRVQKLNGRTQYFPPKNEFKQKQRELRRIHLNFGLGFTFRVSLSLVIRVWGKKLDSHF